MLPFQIHPHHQPLELTSTQQQPQTSLSAIQSIAASARFLPSSSSSPSSTSLPFQSHPLYPPPPQQQHHPFFHRHPLAPLPPPPATTLALQQPRVEIVNADSTEVARRSSGESALRSTPEINVD